MVRSRNRIRDSAGWADPFQLEGDDSDGSGDAGDGPTDAVDGADTDSAMAAPGDDSGGEPANEPAVDSGWPTADGYLLSLPTDVLTRFRRRWRFRPRRRFQQRAFRQSAFQPFAGLARSARRIGAYRHRQSGRRYPVFRARSGSRHYRITTRPGGGRRYEIIGLEQEMGDLEVLGHTQPGAYQPGTRRRVRGARVKVTWQGPMSTTQAARSRGHGVYLVFRGGAPLYVGESDSFVRRWNTRRQVLNNLDLPEQPY